MFTRLLDPKTSSDIQVLVDLALAQEARANANTQHLLATHTPAQIEAKLTEASHLIVAMDASGCLRGAVQPAVWQLKPESMLHAFLADRNGIADLIVPNPQDADTSVVVNLLVEALTDFWQHQGTQADLLRWPAQENWLFPLIAEKGFQLDSICAFHPLTSFFATTPHTPVGLHIRTAQPKDETALLHLFHEELLFHERSTPFVQSSPSVLRAFQHQLERLWSRERFEDGAPLVVVAQLDDEVIAMAENTLLTLDEKDEPGFTPPGHYWCIDNVSVLEKFHRQGIGRLLVQTIEHICMTLDLDLRGYLLWYNPDNSIAERFWSRLGFFPLWTTYQRRRVEKENSKYHKSNRISSP